MDCNQVYFEAMVKIIYSTYYDHIERAGYMPELVVENWLNCDERVVCCPTSQVDRLSSRGLKASIVDIGLGISVPSDIPKAINATVDQCFRMGADWVVFVFGDLYITQACDEIISKNIFDGLTGVIPSMGVQLYAQLYLHTTQLTINSKEHRIIHDPLADGEQLTKYIPPLTDDPTLLLDLGYLGLEQYYKHTCNHIHIWKPNGFKERIIQQYEVGNYDVCTHMIYRSIREWAGMGLRPIEPGVYTYLLDRLGLEDEFLHCLELMKDYRG